MRETTPRIKPESGRGQVALKPEVREYFRQLGLRGGKVGGPIGGRARAARLTAKERSESARHAARARWAGARKSGRT